ncbi:hypothetical protein [Mycobacterium malmoense]|uniref:hypothetical protein n=1 Tax=Mycobacterium malmoense TaxID=1780 RepID=UPI00114D4B3E|nr:hypothetical protein [Mycobacterium malmoense]
MAEHDSFEAARAQAAEYLGFVASEFIKGFEIPNLSMLDDDQAMRLAQLDLDAESWDRYPEQFSPEFKKALTEMVQAALDGEETPTATDMVSVFEDFAREYKGTILVGGAIKEPARKNGELIEPYDIQRAKAVLGDNYEAFRSAGGRASDLTLIWTQMNKKLADRRDADSKSDASPQGVAAVPDADRSRTKPVSPPVDTGVASS